MAQNLSDLISKYGEEEQEHGPRTVTYTCKVPYETRLKLEALSAHFGVKKTPLCGEILETAVNDLFDLVEGNMNEGILQEFYEGMQKLSQI